MVTLYHAIKIIGSRSAIYYALTDLGAMADWHFGGVEGAIAVGKVLTLIPKPGLRIGWRTEMLAPDVYIVLKQIDGPGSEDDRTLSFLLRDLPDGQTQVELKHSDWDATDPHLQFCNTHWGEALSRLKSYVERAR